MSSRRRRRQQRETSQPSQPPSPEPESPSFFHKSRNNNNDDDDEYGDEIHDNNVDESMIDDNDENENESMNDDQSQPTNIYQDDDDDDDNEEESTNPNNIETDIDEDTLRILVSTDNHLGYAERDPIRGNDSFAAFEEVLVLAKRHHCDMVLLAGDLFHENKPTRRTLHKTMTILRKHTMGPNPISFQIISDQAQNFRSTVSPYNVVNYEHPFISIDLPIFSIHGNHDDPTRDGGDEMLAALDLLAMGNLVNYFGRQDAVDRVQVSPILIKKGETKVALYGMGSMRDERLNRMWQGKKVRFLRPESSSGNGEKGRNNEEEEDENVDSEDEEEGMEWFNIFALHQNRDLGRGTKNCVHESMIPEWMDLVVWGHEHECNIVPAESAVGTFRITQPGSSVATSLTEGESLPKNVGILDIRHSQFRLKPIPLMSVRSFSMGQICLADTGLDPDDMRVDQKMSDVLANEVEKLIKEARASSRLLKHRAQHRADEEDNDDGENGSSSRYRDKGDDKSLLKKLDFHVDKPDRVLVRLKVEHSGFSTLHNQRFGSRFVNDVANPSDLLLFHRKRSTDGSSSKSKKKSSDGQDSIPTDPTYPTEIEEINVEDIVKDTLDMDDKKLQILDEDRLGIAVDAFVSKEQKQMIQETCAKIVNIQQKKLVKRGVDADENANKEDGDVKLTTKNAIIEACQAETQKLRDSQFSMDIDGGNDDDDDDDVDENSKKKKRAPTKKRGRQKVESDPEEEFDDDDDIIIESPPPKRGRKRKESDTATNKRGRKARSKPTYDESDDDEDEIVEDVSPPPKRRTARGSRRAATSKSYREDPIEIDDDDDEDDSLDFRGTQNTGTQSSSRRVRRRR